jgi:uncharacterized protein YndB with AHSA1/START domain
MPSAPEGDTLSDVDHRGDPVTTRTFHLLTSASPGDVWKVLTCPVRSPRFLHGLAVSGTWTTGSTLALTSDHGLLLTGRVLFSQRPYKLSWTMEDECSGTCTYLTWELRPSQNGTVVRLRVEESDACATDEEDLEDAWLPSLAALEDLLQEWGRAL